jgi:hypothetical protein
MEPKSSNTSQHGGSSDDPFFLLHPFEPTPGILAVMARQSRMEEIRAYELSGVSRVWSLRGIVSDSVPLSGSPEDVVLRRPHNLFFINEREDPISVYLHSGGRQAIYYDFVGDEKHRLAHIEVRVESSLPSTAVMLARRPLNAMLDVMTRNHNLPLTLQRVDLISPLDGNTLLHQMLLPHNRGIEFGPMGGIQQAVPFAPYDAIYREALTSSSPFYRLLCAARIFEGTATIRKWLRQQCQERGIEPKLPSEVEVDPEQLKRFGLDPTFVASVKTAQDLYHRSKDFRDAIAHFLIEREGADVHVYLAEGMQLYNYSTVGSALLHYAHLSLEQLRMFYTRNVGQRGSHILPTVQNRDQFIVRASSFGLQ